MNDVADWVSANFVHDTAALVVLTQLYFEPVLKYDTFGEAVPSSCCLLLILTGGAL
jgi:hypothetical protein